MAAVARHQVGRSIAVCLHAGDMSFIKVIKVR
jgi:hypothetical protein